eukprot:scaffold7011_cov112-Isochrysis_galbana.AAC.27
MKSMRADCRPVAEAASKLKYTACSRLKWPAGGSASPRLVSSTRPIERRWSATFSSSTLRRALYCSLCDAFMWPVSPCRHVNAQSHPSMSQMNGFSPVCTRAWRLDRWPWRAHAAEKTAPQFSTGHGCFLMPLWVSSCAFSVLKYTNRLSQPSREHSKGCSLLCTTAMCRLSSGFVQNADSQSSHCLSGSKEGLGRAWARRAGRAGKNTFFSLTMSAPSLLRLERRGGGTAWEFVTQAAPTTACVSSSSSLVHTLPGKGSASMNRSAADGKVPPAPSCGGMQFVEAPAVPQSEMPCVGTLRWDEARDFPSLPAFPSRLSRESASAELLGGWRAYLQGRLSPDPSGSVQVEPPMLDGLSYPLTLLLAMRALGLLVPHRKAQLRHVLVIGASSRAEERLVRSASRCQQAQLRQRGSYLPSPLCPCRTIRRFAIRATGASSLTFYHLERTASPCDSSSLGQRSTPRCTGKRWR